MLKLHCPPTQGRPPTTRLPSGHLFLSTACSSWCRYCYLGSLATSSTNSIAKPPQNSKHQDKSRRRTAARCALMLCWSTSCADVHSTSYNETRTRLPSYVISLMSARYLHAPCGHVRCVHLCASMCTCLSYVCACVCLCVRVRACVWLTHCEYTVSTSRATSCRPRPAAIVVTWSHPRTSSSAALGDRAEL